MLGHTDYLVQSDAIGAILNILTVGYNASSENFPHPYIEIMNECRGIETIYALFRKNITKYINDYAAISLGYIFRAKEISDK